MFNSEVFLACLVLWYRAVGLLCQCHNLILFSSFPNHCSTGKPTSSYLVEQNELSLLEIPVALWNALGGGRHLLRRPAQKSLSPAGARSQQTG